VKQALHIFRKDVDQFWPEIAINLALISSLCFTASLSLDPWNQWNGIMQTLLPLNWLFLVARVVQAEPLMGDRQFWVTRPYRWQSLLMAKLAFVTAFIGIPMAISDVIILHAQGFPVVSNAAGIAWEMVLRLAYFALFPMILASLTRSLGGFVIATVATLLGLSFYATIAGRADIHWQPIMIGTVLVPVAIFFQYWRRTKIAVGAVACGALFAVGAMGEPEFYGPSDIPKGPSLKVEFEAHARRFQQGWPGAAEAPLAFEIVIRNLPNGLQVQPGLVRLKLSRPTSDRTYTTQQTKGMLYAVPGDPTHWWLETAARKDFYDKAAGSNVEVEGVADLMLYRNLTPIPVQDGRFAVPGVGFCEIGRNQMLECGSALRRPRVPIHIGPDSTTYFPRTPFPAQLTISPVIVSTLGGGYVKEITVGDAVYSSSATFNLGAIRLEDYLETPKK